MSRLDSAIRRLQAQRACLNLAAGLVRELDGCVLELGLGNGRTYDHMREILPDREIFVFELAVAAHPDCIPDTRHLILGDVRETLGQAAAWLSGRAVLVHCDIGTGEQDYNARLAARLATLLPPLLATGAIIASDQVIPFAEAEVLALPADVSPGRYSLCRWPGSGERPTGQPAGDSDESNRRS
jgi:hypothetical protein